MPWSSDIPAVYRRCTWPGSQCRRPAPQRAGNASVACLKYTPGISPASRRAETSEGLRLAEGTYSKPVIFLASAVATGCRPQGRWLGEAGTLATITATLTPVTERARNTTPCVFCGATGSLSREHVIAKWVRKALQITEPVKVYSGTTYVGAAETLAIVFREVCTNCNTGWMERLESAARPVLEPLLLGAAPGTSRVLDPDQQAVLATWAVKTSLLLTLSEFRSQDYGWIPVSTLQWLHEHNDLRVPPPGSRVWMGGFNTSDVPARVQAGCLYDTSRKPAAQCTTFSVGCILFQVFTTEQDDADLPPDTDAWLAPKGLYAHALLQIAPSISPIRWPPQAVFGADDLESLAGRLRQGLSPKPEELADHGPHLL